MVTTSPRGLKRAPLPAEAVERIRRERVRPRPTQWDYLHLVTLLEGLVQAVARVPAMQGAALDLFCGSQPYREILPWRPLIGLDIDRHFGGADVVGSIPLPFRDASLAAVVCTQALHLVDDPVATVAELRRVLEPGGYAIVSVPRIFRSDLPIERRLERRDLQRLFAGWEYVTIAGAGGAGTGSAYHLGKVAAGAARRWAPARILLTPTAMAINLAGAALDRLSRKVAPGVAASLILTARRPAG